MDPDRAASAAQLALWRSLMVRAHRRGVPRADAEDLAGEAFRKALQAHDPERGDFAALCGTTHANLLRNWWRDRKPTEIWEEQRHDLPGADDPHGALADEEERAMYRQIAERIRAELEPDEAALFLALGDLAREAQRAAVSAAGQRIGLDAQKAWDVFRRIQRKARPFMQEFAAISRSEVLEAPRSDVLHEVRETTFDYDRVCASIRSPLEDWLSPDPLLSLAAHADAGFAAFAAGLSPEQRQRLADLLP